MAFRIMIEEYQRSIFLKWDNKIVLWESCFFCFCFFLILFCFFLLFGSASKYGTISIDFLFLFLLHPLECKFGCQARAEQYLTLMSVVFLMSFFQGYVLQNGSQWIMTALSLLKWNYSNRSAMLKHKLSSFWRGVVFHFGKYHMELGSNSMFANNTDSQYSTVQTADDNLGFSDNTCLLM